MKGRRTVALLCVLLVHALVACLLLQMSVLSPPGPEPDFVSEPITLYLPPEEPPAEEQHATRQRAAASPRRRAPAASTPSAGESSAITQSPFVDWPLEAKKAAERELARQAEIARKARLFPGPQGTWPSLTKRKPSKLQPFYWKPGLDGPEYDEHGNAIFHVSDGCTVKSSGAPAQAMISCALGKPVIHGHMLDDMRKYFDELRLPPIDEGNGTEPEALRPAN